jgi:hypothetical protein
MVRAAALAAVALGSASCALRDELFPPEERGEVTVDLESRLKRIDHLSKLGELRAAIDEAERALVEHPRSQILRDRLSELRSIRQVTFERDYGKAEVEFQRGHPRLALSILRDIDIYGDETMLKRASALRAEIGEVAPRPAVHIEPE